MQRPLQCRSCCPNSTCLDFTHFKRRKRERLQLNGTGSRKFLDISVGGG